MPKNVRTESVIEFLDGDIKRLREAGYTLQQIAEKGGVTRERIRQIIERYYPGVEPKLLLQSEVAKRFGVPRSTLEGFIERGLTHPIKRGSRYRYDDKALEEVKKALNTPCRICGQPIASGNTRLCEKCSIMMRNPKTRLKLPGELEKHRKAVKLWREKHAKAVKLWREKHAKAVKLWQEKAKSRRELLKRKIIEK